MIWGINKKRTELVSKQSENVGRLDSWIALKRKSNGDKCKVLSSIPQSKQTSIESEAEVNVKNWGFKLSISSGIINSLVYKTFRAKCPAQAGRHWLHLKI